MNACQDCRHFNPDDFFMKGLITKRLTSEAIRYGVCGVNTERCKYNRSLSHKCGVEGKWFEPARGEYNGKDGS